MPEGSEGGTKSIGGLLKAQTGPLPNWAWLVVIVGGVAAAYLIPKFLNKNSTTQPDQTSTDAGTGNSGLGLAIDPTTGLPYAVEGLVPSGGVVSTQPGILPPTPVTPPPPTPPTTTTTTNQANNPNYPLLPPNTSVPSRTGEYYQLNGQWYTIVAGPVGRIYGALGKLTAQQAMNAPIGITTKRLLIEPKSAYSPVWPGNTTQTRIGAT